jgi:hypothetical protein
VSPGRIGLWGRVVRNTFAAIQAPGRSDATAAATLAAATPAVNLVAVTEPRREYRGIPGVSACMAARPPLTAMGGHGREVPVYPMALLPAVALV